LDTNSLEIALQSIRGARKTFPVGRVTSIGQGVVSLVGLGPDVCVGDQIRFSETTVGHVITVASDGVIATVDRALNQLSVGAKAQHIGKVPIMPHVGWIGRVIDPTGVALDGRPLLPGGAVVASQAPDPYLRRGLGGRLRTGYAVLDTILPLVRGQRIGLFAGSGVGKSTLLAGLARQVDADVIVLALVGERGREVRDFVADTLGPEGMKRSVVIAATSDSPAQHRKKCAETAMQVAEYFRDQGQEVLLLVDSVTRFAEAHRELSAASGEDANLRGYPPSTASQIAQLCERAGPGQGEQGNITAIFSVLVAGSDMDEPVADMLRGVLDGHIVMSRDIAEAGRFPAIDVLRSVSRSLPKAATEAENQLIAEAREVLGTYAKSELMVRSGLYASGADAKLDRAIKLQPDLERFLARSSDNPNSAFADLRQILRKR
jgi:flagellum-specific ATP synthase